MTRSCPVCQTAFETKSNRKLYCSARHRAEASRRRRQGQLAAALNQVDQAVERVRRVLRLPS